MKLLAILLLLAATAFPASISVDLGRVAHAIKERHDRVPARVKWRRVTAAFAAAATIGDMATTYRGIQRGGCETNPFFNLDDNCTLNRGRFTRVKIGVLLWLGPGEELMHKLPHGAFWDRENIIMNSAAAAVWSGVAINNARQ